MLLSHSTDNLSLSRSISFARSRSLATTHENKAILASPFMDLAIVMIEICPKDLRKKLAQMGSNQIKLNGLYVFLCLWSQPDPQRVCPPSMKLWSTWGSGKEWFWIYVLLLVGILYSWTYLLVTVCVCVRLWPIELHCKRWDGTTCSVWSESTTSLTSLMEKA